MKRHLSIFFSLVILLSASLCPAEEIQLAKMVVGSGATGGVCTIDNQTLLIDRLMTATDASNNAWTATKITVTADSTITEYVIREQRAAGGGTASAMIYSHDAGNDCPLALVTGTSVTNPTLQTSMTNDTYVLATPTQLTGTTYWLVSKTESGATSRAYHYLLGARYCNSTDGTTWACNVNYVHDFQVYGCTP